MLKCSFSALVAQQSLACPHTVSRLATPTTLWAHCVGQSQRTLPTNSDQNWGASVDRNVRAGKCACAHVCVPVCPCVCLCVSVSNYVCVPVCAYWPWPCLVMGSQNCDFDFSLDSRFFPSLPSTLPLFISLSVCRSPFASLAFLALHLMGK